VQTLASDLADPSLEECMERALRACIFPAAPGVTMVAITFVLVPRAPRTRGPPRIRLDDRGPFMIVP
jgi:hypothetical protein